MSKDGIAFSKALALESVTEELKKIPSDVLVKYARTVAYKVFHNLKNGHKMDQGDDPIMVDGKPASEVWDEHYEELKGFAKNFKTCIGEPGLIQTWQGDFPATTKCVHCGGKSRHGFTTKEGYSGTPGEGQVYDLHRNGGTKGDFWLHDYCAVAVYFCKDCLKPSALYNQA